MNAHGLAGPSLQRLAFLLIGIGLLLGLDAYLELSVVYRLWPALLVMLGIGLIGIFVNGNFREPLFLAAGVYVLCFSGLALFCSLTSWSALASLWPLFITFLGFVFLALFFFREKRLIFLLTGLLLVSLSAVFILTLAFGQQWWWTILVLAGLSILVAERVK